MDKENTSVKVAVRIRPLSHEELQLDPSLSIDINLSESQIIAGPDNAFTFDYVFGIDTNQHRIYDDCVTDLIDAFFEGFNATILAYGQTGSGKTWTMGSSAEANIPSQNEGIIPRVITHLFDQVRRREKEQPNCSYKVHVQFLEIYGEEIRDLLDQTKTSEVTIRETREHGVFVSGAREELVSSYEQMMKTLEDGSRHRVTASTRMNQTSSRSHAIFTVILEHVVYSDTTMMDTLLLVQADAVAESTVATPDPSAGARQQQPQTTTTTTLHSEVRKSKFHFVDLAGSERAKRTGAVGQQLREGIDINKGLLALGNVISALGDDSKRGKVFVPYRDSKLTRMLQDSLGGNSKTLMICCVSPSSSNFNESVNALRYANRARNIKNKPIVNRDPTVVVIEQLKQLLGAMSVELLEVRRARSYVESGDVMIPLDTLESWAATHHHSSSNSKPMHSKLTPHKALKETHQRPSITSDVMPSFDSDENAALKLQLRESDHEVLRLTNAIRLVKQQSVEANDSLILALSERDFYRMKWSDACPDEAKALDEGEAAASKGIDHQGGGSDAEVVDSSSTTTTTTTTTTDVLREKKHAMKCVSTHLREIESLKKDLAVEKAKNASYHSGLTNDSEAMFDADFTNSISTLLTQTREQLKLESERLKKELGGVDREMVPSSLFDDSHLLTTSEHDGKDDAYMKRQDLLSSEVRELGKSIQLKEQLMTQLLRSKEQYGAMKAYYENKLASLSVVMAEKQRERNMLLIELQDVSTVGEKSDALVQRESKEKQLRDELKRKDEELKSMKMKQEELQRLAHQQSSYSQQLQKLEHDISSMKKQRIDLSRTLQAEKKSHITQLAEKVKEIDRLRKELERSAVEVKRIERDRDLAETRAKDAIRDGAMLRRKTNEFLRSSTGPSATVPSTLAAYKTMDKMSRLGGALSGSKRIFTEEELKTKRWIDKRIEDIARREAAADALKAQYEHQLELLTRKESLQQEKDIALKHKQGSDSNTDKVPSEFDAPTDVNMILSAEEREKLIEIEEQLSDIDRVLNVKSLQMNDIAEQLVDSGDAVSSDKTMEILKRTAAGSLPAAHELIRLLFDMLLQSSRSCRVRTDEVSGCRESIGALKLEVQELQLQLASAKHRHDVELMTTSSEYEQKMQDLFQHFSSILHKECDNEMTTGTATSSDNPQSTQIALLMEETAFLRSQLQRDSSELVEHKLKARELENAKNKLHAEIRDKADQLRFLEEDRSLFKSLTDDLRAGLLSLGKQGKATVDSIRDRYVRVNGKRGVFSEFGGAMDDDDDGGGDSESILNEFSLLAEEIFRTGTIPSSTAPPSVLQIPAANSSPSDAVALSPKNLSGTTVSTSYSNSIIINNNSNNNNNNNSKSIYDRLTNPSNYTGYMKNVFENDLELKRKKIQLQRGNNDKKPSSSGTYRDSTNSKRNASDQLLLPPPISMMSIGVSDSESNENASPVALSSDSSCCSAEVSLGSSPIKLHLRNGSPSGGQYNSSSSSSSSSSSGSSSSSVKKSSTTSLLPPRPPPPTTTPSSTSSTPQSTASPSVPC